MTAWSRSRLRVNTCHEPSCRFLTIRKKAWYEPYVSVELYAAKKLEKMRYTAGCEFKINKHNIVDVFYRYQDINGGDNYNDRDSHILGIGYLFKF